MIGRRGLLSGGLAAMIGRGGLPGARLDQAYRPGDQPGSPGTSSSVLRARQVVLSGGVLLLGYSPSAGLGNLVESVSALPANTTDQYGNTILSGMVQYWQSGGNFFAAQINKAFQILTAAAPGGPWTTTMQFGNGFAPPALQIAGSVIMPTTRELNIGAPTQLLGDIQAQILLQSVAAGRPQIFTIGDVNIHGRLDILTVGQGIAVAEGANAKQGTATLAAGTVTVANTSVTANSRIFLTTQTPGGAPGGLYVSARVAGTSFTVTSTSATDTSTFAYEIIEPG